MISTTVVDLSRLQFAATALYHFLFVPLTLGLGFLLAAMESVYVITNKPIYKQMTLFWSKLFAINFALGVATGLTMEFEFGTNWSFFSHYVGDIFGAPLAIEGLMAFFMESTLVGLMFFGWNRLGRISHLVITYLAALGANLSALWILVGNGFMQHPVGAHFNPFTMRMELQSFSQLIFNPDAQNKFVHTTAAGYVTASIFVMGISGWYILRKRHLDLARRSFRMATIFGMLSIIATITLGDALGYLDGQTQPSKLAAMEAIWKTAPAPAGFNLIAIPSQSQQKNLFSIKIPYLLTPLVTHTFTKTIPGVLEIEKNAAQRMKDGIPALLALKELSQHPTDKKALEQFRKHQGDLGYALLLQEFSPNQDVSKATPADIQRAARASIPEVPVIYWAFRIMVAAGFAMLFILVYATYCSLKNTLDSRRWLLKLLPWAIPLPFIACETGWITAEMGRQPWTVFGMLPTWHSASSHTVGYMVFSLAGFVLLYSVFIIIEMYLMFKFARQGPDEHGGAGDSPTAGEPETISFLNP